MKTIKRILTIILCCVTIFSCCATYFFTPVKVYASEPITYWTFEQLVSYFMAAMGLSTSNASVNQDAWHNVCERMASDITDSVSLPAAYLKGTFGVISTMEQSTLAVGTKLTHELWANMTQAISDAWNEVYGNVSSLFVKSYSGDVTFYSVDKINVVFNDGSSESGFKFSISPISTVSNPRNCIAAFYSGGLYYFNIFANFPFILNYSQYEWNTSKSIWDSVNSGSQYISTDRGGYYQGGLGFSTTKLDDFESPVPVFNTNAIAEQYLIDGDETQKEKNPTIAYPLAIPASIGNVLDGSAIGTPSTVDDLAAAIAGALADTFPAALDPAAVPDTTIEKAKDDTKKVIAPAISIPTAANDSSLSYKFDLKDLFPFCIPFDLIDFLTALEATREAPKFNFPINIKFDNPFNGQTIIDYSHTFVLDFAEYEAAAAVFRTCMLIEVIVGLIILTRNIIRG